MGIQIITIVDDVECMGESDGKSLAGVFTAMQMGGIGVKGSGKITKIDFKTGEVTEEASDGGDTDSGIDEFAQCLSEEPCMKKSAYDQVIAISLKLKRYLEMEENRMMVIEQGRLDDDHIDGAIYDLDNMVSEISRAKKSGLGYCIYVSM